MIKMLFFYRKNESQSKIQEEIVSTIEALFKGKVKVERVVAEENKMIVEDYGLNEIPAIIIEKDGKVADKFIGFTQELFLKRALERNLER